MAKNAQRTSESIHNTVMVGRIRDVIVRVVGFGDVPL